MLKIVQKWANMPKITQKKQKIFFKLCEENLDSCFWTIYKELKFWLIKHSIVKVGGNYKRPKSKIAVLGIGVVLSG